MTTFDTILTCSNCSNKYSVPDHELRNGRLVRCMSCGYEWVYSDSVLQTKFEGETECSSYCVKDLEQPDCDLRYSYNSGAIGDIAQEIVKVQKAKKPSAPIKKTISFLMIISIIGNIIFWICYFLQFSVDYNKYLAYITKLFK